MTSASQTTALPSPTHQTYSSTLLSKIISVVTAVRIETILFLEHLAYLLQRTVIQSLMRASGRLGLEAFLPSPHRVAAASENAPRLHTEDVPHLSLEERWQDGQFSIHSTLATSSQDVNVRDWALRLLERYRFVIGESLQHLTKSTARLMMMMMTTLMLAYTPYAFVMLETVDNTHDALGWINSYRDVGLVCINDDVREDEQEVTAYFREWQDKKWGRHAAWERK